MAQQDEPLYDFPEPSQPSERKFLGHQRGRASLRSISVLDRLLLTVPVWLQLSINPATALHIMQREPPGAFLVRKSRTSQRNVLCVRLADDSVPSFVQQFGIREEHSSKTLSLETSSISFPDLPRLISFYCVSRDVLPFPLELPEAIAKATSHKELESISHMGIEFWSSQLNVRGPREAPKPQKDKEKKPDAATSTPPAAAPQTSSAAQTDSAPQPDSDNQLKTAPESDAASKKSVPDPTLFHEFCPITTRSPRELDCGSGQGDLCFINPLFLQSQNTLCRRRMFKHSLKVRVSTETSTMLSPPLAPPPPPPLMPKTKGKCRAPKRGQGTAHPSEGPGLLQGENPSQATQIDPTVQDTGPQPLTQTQMEPGLSKAGVIGEEATAQLPTVTEHLADESDYMQPSPMINFSHSPSLSPYQSPSSSPMAPPLFPKVSQSCCAHDSSSASPSPYQSPSSSPMAPPLFPKVSQSRCPHDSSSASPMAPPLFPKVSQSRCPHDSPSASPSLSPYQSPSSSPMAPPLFPKVSPSRCPHDSRSASPSLSPCQSPSSSPKVLFSLSPHDSPSASPSLSPHQSPSSSPKVPFSLSPFTSPCFSQLVEQAYHTPATSSRLDQQRSEREAEEEGAGVDENEDKDNELHKKREEEERVLVLQMNAASLNDADSCSSFSSLEGAAETPPHLPHKQNNGTNILDCN